MGIQQDFQDSGEIDVIGKKSSKYRENIQFIIP